ncbi:MAG: YraN family protein [SAR202 cluster bacterium]|nr:YraN family protein [SAR202 cluster bacterium]
MTNRRQETGKRGEEAARKFLERRGYRVLETNYRTRFGEIDIVGEKNGAVAFLEVRTRAVNSPYGSPEESLTSHKRSHMVLAAQLYLQHKRMEDRDWRIDLVAVEIGAGGRIARMSLVENAIEL